MSEMFEVMFQVGDMLDFGVLFDVEGCEVFVDRLVGECGMIVVVVQLFDWSFFCNWQVGMWNEWLEDVQVVGY